MKRFSIWFCSVALVLCLFVPRTERTAQSQKFDLPKLNFQKIEQLRVQILALTRRVSQLESKVKTNNGWEAKAKKLEHSVRILKLSLDLHTKKMEEHVKKMNSHTHTYDSNNIVWNNRYVSDIKGKTILCSYVFVQRKTPFATSSPR